MFKINGREIGEKNPPYIIAELSANHNGSIEKAKKTIELAKSCGTHAIKLQPYNEDSMTINCDKNDFIINEGLWNGYKLFDLYKEATTPYDWHKELFEHAKNLGITIFSTPFDEKAADLLESLGTPAYKIASFELTDYNLVNEIAKLKKPIILSTGLANLNEIKNALKIIRKWHKKIILMYCVSSYPTKLEE